MFLNNKQIIEEIEREIKTFLETSDNKNTTTQNVWDAAKPMLRELDSNTVLPQETRKTLNREPTYTPKTTGKRRRMTTTTTKTISRRKETIKI